MFSLGVFSEGNEPVETLGAIDFSDLDLSVPTVEKDYLDNYDKFNFEKGGFLN